MTEDSAIMSVDFLVGFTIFLLAFIWVATMVPGLFINLQSHTIDFDAVAYRTGVILAEDPGAETCPSSGICVPWEYKKDERDITRLGLAIAKNTPNILAEKKVDRFFCSTAYSGSTSHADMLFTYPHEYRPRITFSDYPYNFNISFRVAGEERVRSIGDIIPNNYGIIQRAVKIKSGSNSTIDKTLIKRHVFNNTENVEFHTFSIVINSSQLRSGQPSGGINDPGRETIYQINPPKEGIIINITDIEETRNQINFPVPPSLVTKTLSDIRFYQWIQGQAGLYEFKPAHKNFTYEDGNTTPVYPPFDFQDKISMVFEPGFFVGTDPYGAIYINLTYQVDPPQQFMNNSHPASQPFDYNYNPVNVTQPSLKDAVLEVAVW